MSQKEPDRPYAFQPDPAKSVTDKAWAVSGPGTEKYQGKRFTKAEAESLAEQIDDGQQNAWFGKAVVLPFRREVIRSLLRGNDSLAFTTMQYRQRYEKFAAETFKTGAETLWEDGQAESHLRTSGIVREVVPGVWVPVETRLA